MPLNHRFAPAVRNVLRLQACPWINIRQSIQKPLLRAGVATSGHFKLPNARNEENLHYAKASPERLQLDTALRSLRSQLPLPVPLHVSGSAKTTSSTLTSTMPSEHAQVFASSSSANAEDVHNAIKSALEAKKSWQATPFVDRAAIFLKAAELVTGKYRYDLVAATMLGQGKNAWQAEIDAAAELADFFRFNVSYAEEVYNKQPTLNAPGNFGRTDWRPLEGFVYAISPFNFTAIGGNLISGPAIMGNVVLWKPSPTGVYASWLVYQILLEAGLPPNVIQFLPGDAETITKTVYEHKEFSALNFTGSSDVFRSLYGKAAEGVVSKKYRDMPRMVGETSGKNFHLIHSSADINNAVKHTIRASFEYSGQKCSACSRVYIPHSRSQEFLDQIKREMQPIKVGQPEDYENFLGPVIHKASFDKIANIIDKANADSRLQRIFGGSYNGSKGHFIHPSLYVANTLDHELFDEEIFGPVLVAYVYPDKEFDQVMAKIDTQGGGFALTGAIFAKDRTVLRHAEDTLRYAAGNFYLNCKTTGAVIGHQSFGGSRSSGTNDKAGSANTLMRFTSPRTLKEEMIPLQTVLYPSNLA
ncbi:pyrroline-5-carboxylate dehydrogenase [Aureobasidium pullulans]|uniref:Multifunctional fusion protein n=1 Tax=Aureobasidium pullulans TaxID=5580 RepID=A0A4S9W3G9_AURPU|nr:pyrroline-5-carboxylate dehydrogenase [Aureobasidium pullulans]THZ34780.1 pyrroline-5-carboxylate dehydrogenase [Aureobasidium pullulans]THZ59593.1 pyrroline-5-carboxylate dehydrogenase [Aureobasidium pullulans]THZ84028.1 pyrroline-5-carboxylate dehydrogenase [Aureobasidium pullulans]